MHEIIQRFCEKLDYAPREQSKIIDAFEAIGITQGALDMLQERLRQMESEGWSREDDMRRYRQGELAQAAANYADEAATGLLYAAHGDNYQNRQAPQFWPFDKSWWKPTTPKRNLEKAMALGLAQLDILASTDQ